MLLKTSSSTIIYSSVNYDSLQTEHYCKLNALELCITKSITKTRRSVEHYYPHADGAWLNELGWSQ